GCLLGLEANLGVTTTEPAPEGKLGGGSSTSSDRTNRADRSASLPNAGWLSVHARRHHGEVCPLSGGVMWQPLSGPLPAGLRLLPDPLPAVPSARLAVRFPLREDYGLTTLRCGHTAWVRSRPYAGGSTAAPGEFGAHGLGHVPCGPSQQHLGLVLV